MKSRSNIKPTRIAPFRLIDPSGVDDHVSLTLTPDALRDPGLMSRTPPGSMISPPQLDYYNTNDA
jgi:hypothetical protein